MLESIKDVVFVGCALVCIISAFGIVTRKNPVYSVIFMLPFFVGMTILFVLLNSTFLAAMQMMVYGGAILVTFLFVIMLINLQPDEIKDDLKLTDALLPGILCGCLGGLIWVFTWLGLPNDSALEKAFQERPAAVKGDVKVKTTEQATTAYGSIESLGLPLFTRFVVPFEMVSVLIMVALIGSVLLSKKNPAKKAGGPPDEGGNAPAAPPSH